MENQESTESRSNLKTVILVDKYSDIPLNKGYMLFNPGHTHAISEIRPDFFDNSLTRMYRIRTDPEVHTHALLNISGLFESPLFQDHEYIGLLLDYAQRQIRNDAQGAVTGRELLDMGLSDEAKKSRFEESRHTFLTHLQNMEDFIVRLEASGQNLSAYRENINGLLSLKSWTEEIG